MTIIDKAIIAAIVLLLVAIIVGFERRQDTFTLACKESGGTAVHDGRQWQCLKREGGR